MGRFGLLRAQGGGGGTGEVPVRSGGLQARAVKASNLPARLAVYDDPEVLAAAGWFADALPVVETAMPRPTSPRYNEISDVIRSSVNAVVAGAVTPESAAAQMESRLRRAMR